MNNHKRNFFILGTLFGVLLSVTALAAFLYLPANFSDSPEKLTTDQAISLIKNKKIKEAHFRGDQVNFTDVDEENHLLMIKNDAKREILLKEIGQANENNRKPMKVTEEPQHSGLNILTVLNFLLYSIIAFCLIYSLYKYLSFKTKDKDLE